MNFDIFRFVELLMLYRWQLDKKKPRRIEKTCPVVLGEQPRIKNQYKPS